MSELDLRANEVIYNSPWRNAYWFARMLLNTDQYGAVGKRDELMTALANELEAIVEQPQLFDEEKRQICLGIIHNKIAGAARPKSKTAGLYPCPWRRIEDADGRYRVCCHHSLRCAACKSGIEQYSER